MTESQLQATADALIDAPLVHSSINGNVALGVSESTRAGHYAWIIVRVVEHRVAAAEVRFVQIDSDADSVMGVESAILASEGEWRRIAAEGHAGVIAAAERFTLTVWGRLPYFIRHLRSITELAVVFSRAVPA